MIKPLFKNVLINIHKSSFTGMEQVDEREENLEQATVLAIGNEVQCVEMGDVIAFKNYNLDTIELDGIKYTLLPEEDIKLILKDSSNNDDFNGFNEFPKNKLDETPASL